MMLWKQMPSGRLRRRKQSAAAPVSTCTTKILYNMACLITTGDHDVSTFGFAFSGLSPGVSVIAGSLNWTDADISDSRLLSQKVKSIFFLIFYRL